MRCKGGNKLQIFFSPKPVHFSYFFRITDVGLGALPPESVLHKVTALRYNLVGFGSLSDYWVQTTCHDHDSHDIKVMGKSHPRMKPQGISLDPRLVHVGIIDK